MQFVAIFQVGQSFEYKEFTAPNWDQAVFYADETNHPGTLKLISLREGFDWQIITDWESVKDSVSMDLFPR